jgi:hypothetical protein
MPSTKPLQWIEQAEARKVMAHAKFRQAPPASRREPARITLAEWLQNWRRRVVSYVVPECPMRHAQSVRVRRQTRRHRPVRHPGHH